MPSLYNLTHEMITLIEAEEETSQEQLDEVFALIQRKELGVMEMISALDGEIELHKLEEARIRDRRKKLENRQEWLRNAIKYSMEMLGTDKIKVGTHTMTLRPSQGSLEIYNQEEIPNEFIEVVTTYKVRTAEVKKAIKDGQEIPGARIIPGTALYIR